MSRIFSFLFSAGIEGVNQFVSFVIERLLFKDLQGHRQLLLCGADDIQLTVISPQIERLSR